MILEWAVFCRDPMAVIRALRGEEPVIVRRRGKAFVRIAPPGKVVPPRMPVASVDRLSNLGKRAAVVSELICGVPVVLTYYRVCAMVLVPVEMLVER